MSDRRLRIPEKRSQRTLFTSTLVNRERAYKIRYVLNTSSLDSLNFLLSEYALFDIDAEENDGVDILTLVTEVPTKILRMH